MSSLRTLREKKGLSLRALAQRTGLALKTVWRYEKGLSAPTLRSARVLCRELDVELVTLALLMDEPARAVSL